MGTERDYGALQSAAAKFELIHGLHRSLDLSYQRLLHTAKEEWDRRFAGKEPSDSCVTVRIAAPDAKNGVRGSGFLKRRPQPEHKTMPFPRLVR
ncbi:MAG: hypothetical protein ABJB69_03415 [Spartobacteria bacterium]